MLRKNMIEPISRNCVEDLLEKMLKDEQTAASTVRLAGSAPGGGYHTGKDPKAGKSGTQVSGRKHE